jgi:hypothetical protein
MEYAWARIQEAPHWDYLDVVYDARPEWFSSLMAQIVATRNPLALPEDRNIREAFDALWRAHDAIRAETTAKLGN